MGENTFFSSKMLFSSSLVYVWTSSELQRVEDCQTDSFILRVSRVIMGIGFNGWEMPFNFSAPSFRLAPSLAPCAREKKVHISLMKDKVWGTADHTIKEHSL